MTSDPSRHDFKPEYAEIMLISTEQTQVIAPVQTRQGARETNARQRLEEQQQAELLDTLPEYHAEHETKPVNPPRLVSYKKLYSYSR